jgi:L,D-peptidoglycan transpeptidase YkuD (ErfK/YbiS/YcfS/YnhG family)
MPIIVSAPGRLECGGGHYCCALGRAGIVADKVEGDGGTPVGTYPLRYVLYRADRLAAPPATGLPVEALTPDRGWCDDPDHPDYNRPVTLPFAASHEKLWREDGLYDVIVVLGHNDDPPRPGKGSAIFMHVARPDYGPTEGCVALALPDLLELLAGCTPDTSIRINPPDKAVGPRK